MLDTTIKFAAGARRNDRPILQAEGAECGLACLAMIANAQGHEIDLNGLRVRFPIGRDGASVADIVRMAADLHLAARVVRAEPEQLHQLALPAILHWRMRHFVILRAVSGSNRFILDDPALGRRSVSWDELGREFTGVAIEFGRAEHFEALNIKQPTRLGEVLGDLKGWRAPAALILFFSLFAQLGLLAIPVMIQFAVDRVAIAGNGDLLLAALVGFLSVAGVTALAGLLRDWTMIYVGNTILFQTVARIVNHMQRLPASFFELRHVADIISRIGSLQPIQTALTRGIASAMLDGAFAVILLAFIFLYSTALGAFAAVTTIVLFLVILAFQGALRRREEEQLAHSAEEQSFMMETIRNIRTIQVFGREPERESAWQNKYAHVLNRTAATSRVRAYMKFAEEIVLALQLAGFIYIGVSALLVDGSLSIGALAALLAFRQLLAARLSSFTTEVVQFRMLELHLNRLGDIVHTPAQPAPCAAGEAGQVVKGGLSLREVSYAYPGTRRPVLQEINMEVPAGGLVALTGRSGAGKSTLFKVMLGLLEPTEGQLEVDGAPLTAATLRSWRRHVGVVMQDDRVFTGTLLENVTFFDPTPDMDAARRACDQAELLTFIDGLPMGLHTFLGSAGASLSGGEAQRLFLARALYRKPKLLFLDEGTANLDLETESKVADTIAALPITRFVIAHRRALIDRADLVFRMEEGAVQKVDA